MKWRSCDVFTEQTAVMVVEGRYGKIESRSHQPAISEFITIQFFRAKVLIGIEARKIRQPGCSSAYVTGEGKVLLRIRRCTYGMCEGGPQGLGLGGGIQKTQRSVLVPGR